MKLKNDHCSKFQPKELERSSLKKIRALTGFEPVTSATGVIFFQLSYMYEATHWERGQLIEFISSRIYGILHI